MPKFNSLEVARGIKLLLQASHELGSFPALGKNLGRLGILQHGGLQQNQEVFINRARLRKGKNKIINIKLTNPATAFIGIRRRRRSGRRA